MNRKLAKVGTAADPDRVICGDADEGAFHRRPTRRAVFGGLVGLGGRDLVLVDPVAQGHLAMAAVDDGLRIAAGAGIEEAHLGVQLAILATHVVETSDRERPLIIVIGEERHAVLAALEVYVLGVVREDFAAEPAIDGLLG